MWAGACHRALENHPRVREWCEGRGFGRELQKRFLLGATKDGTTVVIPFWHRGRVEGLIRRKLEGEPRYLNPTSEEFAGGYKPLFTPGPVRAGAVLVEGIVDALANAALGESTIAVGGTGISPRQMAELQRLAGPLYVLPDADAPSCSSSGTTIRRSRRFSRRCFSRASPRPCSTQTTSSAITSG
jgi:DNA primase